MNVVGGHAAIEWTSGTPVLRIDSKCVALGFVKEVRVRSGLLMGCTLLLLLRLLLVLRLRFC